MEFMITMMVEEARVEDQLFSKTNIEREEFD
jgi:hypothetical protein